MAWANHSVNTRLGATNKFNHVSGQDSDHRNTGPHQLARAVKDCSYNEAVSMALTPAAHDLPRECFEGTSDGLVDSGTNLAVVGGRGTLNIQVRASCGIARSGCIVRVVTVVDSILECGDIPTVIKVAMPTIASRIAGAVR